MWQQLGHPTRCSPNASAADTVLGTTPDDVTNPLVLAALAVLDGLPLVRVGRVIDPDTSGWYVRPELFRPMTGSRRLTVRYVRRGDFRPAPATARRLRALAERRFLRAGWTLAHGPATVLTVQAPAEQPATALRPQGAPKS
ncbi:hypothetical protein ACWGFX_18100 [Streptomyces xanthophaeus]